MKRFVLSILLACLFLSPAVAAEHQTVYATAEWLSPNNDPLWQPWMAGQTIDVTISVATQNGQYNYSAYATIDYEAASTSCVIDVTGLGDDPLWMVLMRIEPQTISNGQQSVTVSSPSKVMIYKGEPWSTTLFLGLLTIDE